MNIIFKTMLGFFESHLRELSSRFFLDVHKEREREISRDLFSPPDYREKPGCLTRHQMQLERFS